MGDKAAERLFATCTDDGTYDDLHLVKWESHTRIRVKLLCGGCRVALAERITLNVPLPLSSLAALAQMEAQRETAVGRHDRAQASPPICQR